MGKNIKNIFKYFVIIAGIIFMIPTVLYLVLQIPEVQTYLVSRVSEYLSKKTNSTISVSRVEYKFFNKLSVDNLLVKDRNSDTLLYSEELVAGIRQLDYRNNAIKLGRILLVKPVLGLVNDSGVLNFQYYLDYLKKPADTTAKNKTSLFIDEIDISEARFSYKNYSGTKGKTLLDFNNININGLNAVIDDLNMEDDTTTFNIYNLGFAESSGLTLKRLSSTVKLVHQDIILSSLSFDCDSSNINIPELTLHATSPDAFQNFGEKVRIDIQIDRSLVSTSELRYFIPSVNGFNESIWLSGKFFGTISELRGRNVELYFRDYSYIDLDFDFSGLPNIENTFMYLGINTLRTNAKDIDKIKIPGKGNIVVPDFLYKLDNISFDGSFTGFTTDFVTYGEIRSHLGTIRTDVSLRPDAYDVYKVKGLLTGNEINLGELTGKSKLLGKMTMHNNIDGYVYSLKKFEGNLTGKIDSVEINRYIYRNISLNGTFTQNTWDGSININDENIRLDLLGLFNFKDTLPEFHFTLNLADADLFALNLTKADSNFNMTALLTSNFKGNNIDNLDGEIKLINSTLTRNKEVLEMYDFSIRTFAENNKPVLSLRTDFVDADIRGYYNFALLGTLVKSAMAKLMPSKFSPPPESIALHKNNFGFYVNFKNTDNINNFFRTGVQLAEKSYLSGTIASDSVVSIDGRSKLLIIKNNVITDLSMNADFRDSELSVKLHSPSISILNQSELKDFTVRLDSKPDDFVFSVDWNNNMEIVNRGNIVAHGTIRKDKLRKNAIMAIGIDSTDIYINDNLWKVSKSSMVIDSSAFNIDNFLIRNVDRFYLVDGSVSEDPYDTLQLEFKGIDIDPLNYIGNRKNPASSDKIALNLKGILDGKISLTNVHSDMLIEGNLLMNNFSIFGASYGNITIGSEWDKVNKVAKINVMNDMKGINMFNASGFYEPRRKKIDITVNTKRLPVEFLNPLLKVFASDVRGLATGRVTLTGETNNLWLQGSLYAEDASMKINYLQTRYRLNDSIRFDKNGFNFNKIRITDDKGNLATLNGVVHHKNFKDFKADLQINANKTLVLNTKPKDNGLFYGTAYASGVTTIKSEPNALVFDISAKTEENTNFFIPLNRGLSVSENSFISFIDSSATSGKITDAAKSPAPPKQTGMDVNFDLEVTPEAEVQLIFDSKVGDVMKGRGSGNLNITYNQKGDLGISGVYNIEEGTYLFTLQNILNKSFAVENGGKITFNGNINNAEIDLNAIYKLRTSLDKILQDSSLKERIPVDCHLNLTGNLWNPVVTFDISLPTADEQTRTNLRNAISTEEALSRQFLYLLVMNSFYADPSAGNATATNATGTSAMAVTTTEMLSNQLSNWLSQISKDVDLGFVYRPGNKDINPQELEVALSTQILNDRLTINGNFDVRGSGNASEYTDQITGDFDAEISLTEKIRFKVFNRFNNTYSGKGPYTQGIGIFFKQDFNKFSDLFKKKKKDEMKKEKEVIIEK